MEHFNSCHEAIKFKQEKEADGVINFLDVSIQREEDGSLRTSVFRKETATDRYLDFTSSHSNRVKWGLVSCLKRRASRICSDEEDLHRELERLRGVFLRNGFPSKTLDRRLRQDHKKEPRDKKPFLTVPYVEGLSSKIERLAASLGLEIRYHAEGYEPRKYFDQFKG